MKNCTVLVILTGGTIDGFIAPGVKPRDKTSRVKKYMGKLKLHEKFCFETACKKDSREITDTDRKKMLEIVAKHPAKRVIIAHGTFTMAQTAKYLEKNLAKNNKVIVLTGSLAPFGEPFTDAEFNLGYAVLATQIMKNGVYLCMNGRVFKPATAVKNARKKMFEAA